eukprot:1902318-Rhodomonas_salina.2
MRRAQIEDMAARQVERSTRSERSWCSESLAWYTKVAASKPRTSSLSKHYRHTPDQYRTCVGSAG